MKKAGALQAFLTLISDKSEKKSITVICRHLTSDKDVGWKNKADSLKAVSSQDKKWYRSEKDGTWEDWFGIIVSWFLVLKINWNWIVLV